MKLFVPEDPLRTLRVLVVEDQMQQRSFIVDMLREIGVRDVRTAVDGADALAVMKEYGAEIDLVLCDWLMPRMSGIDLLRAIRKTRPDLAFIMQTGNGTLDAVMEARKEGVTAFVVKPFSCAQLEVKLRIACRNRKPGLKPSY
ncbi:MAG TPA: response regulator [Azospirillaceae bacterium]|nr:response regulator [Azospirillaceae bacterium]